MVFRCSFIIRCIRERSRALPVCEYLRQARQTTLGESGVAKLAECNLEGGKIQCTLFVFYSAICTRLASLVFFAASARLHGSLETPARCAGEKHRPDQTNNSLFLCLLTDSVLSSSVLHSCLTCFHQWPLLSTLSTKRVCSRSCRTV